MRHADCELFRVLLASALPGRRWAGRLSRIQAARLRQLLSYACRFSPYYAALGRTASDIRGADGLSRIPVLDRETAQTRSRDLLSREMDPASYRWRTTTGSSGRPLELAQTRLEFLHENFLWARGYLEYGARVRQTQVKVAARRNIPRNPHRFQRCGFLRRVYVPAEDPPEAIVQKIRNAQPHSLVCWSSMLSEICAHLQKSGERLDIPLVFTSSDMLWPHVRRTAEDLLGARVVDVYGSIETGPIAWSCPSGSGYHVRSDDVVLEILDEDGRPARTGRIICTVLWRRATPLIRYALGDLGEWAQGPCPCGSPFPLLESLRGREQEMVTLPDGAEVTGTALRICLSDAPSIRQYQMVQETPDSFFLRVVPGPDFTDETARAIVRAFQEQFRGQVRLRVIRVGTIPRSPEIKFTSLVTLRQIERMRRAGRDVRLMVSADP